MFTEEQIADLTAKLDPAHVKGRKQGNQQLSYVEGWFVIAEANRIFGFDSWARETIRLEETNRDLVTLRGDRGEYQQWRVGYLAVVKITVFAGDTLVTRHGSGFGSGMAKPEALGDAVESAIKEAETDAMKRAFMTFGNPFGLALYDKSKANVGRDEEPEREATPQPNGSATAFSSKAEYIDWCREEIERRREEGGSIQDWWKGQATARRRYRLTQDEVDGLMARAKAAMAGKPATVNAADALADMVEQ